MHLVLCVRPIPREGSACMLYISLFLAHKNLCPNQIGCQNRSLLFTHNSVKSRSKKGTGSSDQ